MRTYISALIVGVVFSLLLLLGCAQMSCALGAWYAFVSGSRGAHTDYFKALSWLTIHATYLYLAPPVLIVFGVWIQRRLATSKTLLNFPDWLTSDKFAKSMFSVSTLLAGLFLAALALLSKGKMLLSFMFLLGQAVSGLLGLFPATALLLAAFGLSCKVGPKKAESRFLLAAIPFLIPMVMLMWGAYWCFPTNPDLIRSGHCWQMSILSAFFYTYLVLCAALIVLFRGYRRFFTAMFINGMWFFLLCEFVAAMAITNEWL